MNSGQSGVAHKSALVVEPPARELRESFNAAVTQKTSWIGRKTSTLSGRSISGS